MSQYSNHLFTPGTKNNSWSHLNNYVKIKDRVLDVGCSSGNFGEALIHLKKCEVIGIDIDAKDVILAKKVLTNAFELDINDTENYKLLGKFDVIIFADVIEHLIDPRETLRKVKKLLNKNGKIIFSIPNMAHISVRLQLLAGEFPYKNRGILDRTHLHFYDANEVEDVFKDSGYIINAMSPVVSRLIKSQYIEKLTRIGLVYSPEFEKNVEKTGGYIFQFIGMSQPTTKDIGSKRDLNYRMPQDELAQLAQNSESIARKAEAETLKLKNDNVRLINENSNIKREVSAIKKSISWKVTKPLRAPKALVKKGR